MSIGGVYMSLTNAKRERIKYYIMENIFYNQKDFVKRTSEAFNISATTIYNYLKELIEDGKITKNTDGFYELCKTINKKFRYNLKEKNLQEDIVYRETLQKYVMNFPQNVINIWEYSFMEMFNNVIDHSEAETVAILIQQNALYTWVNIADNGIGIFKKISDFYQYASLDDAILSLFKGKLTTDKEHHSGEGIFFTSKLVDHFSVTSSNKRFSQHNTKEQLTSTSISGLKQFNNKPGTLVTLALSNNSNHQIKEVFDMYSNDNGGFTITRIPIKHVCDTGYPVSRSQAKRLYFGFEKFERVILDFSDVSDIGQGFAHELFYVFANKHPEIDLQIENASESIQKMIYRAQHS